MESGVLILQWFRLVLCVFAGVFARCLCEMGFDSVCFCDFNCRERLPLTWLLVDFPILQEAIIGGLQSETTYSVTVAAYTTKGDGARSKAKIITTTGAGESPLYQGY